MQPWISRLEGARAPKYYLLTFRMRDELGPALVTLYFTDDETFDYATLHEQFTEADTLVSSGSSNTFPCERVTARVATPTGRRQLQEAKWLDIPGVKHQARFDPENGKVQRHVHLRDVKKNNAGSFNKDGTTHDRHLNAGMFVPKAVLSGMKQMPQAKGFTYPPNGYLESIEEPIGELLLG